jgi:hypothetical protein
LKVRNCWLSIQICSRCDGSRLALVVWESAIGRYSDPGSREICLVLPGVIPSAATADRGVQMAPEPSNVAFVQRIKNARTFKINPLEEIVVTVPSERSTHFAW